MKTAADCCNKIVVLYGIGKQRRSHSAAIFLHCSPSSHLNAKENSSFSRDAFVGGLSDVGRHAILAALEIPSVEKITVITEYPEKLNEKNWESHGEKTNPFDDHNLSKRLEMVKIDTWKKEQTDLAQYFAGATGVVSCLGHRQPGWKHPELKTRGLIAYDGSRQVIAAMNEAKVDRVVAISSFGIGSSGTTVAEWPHWASKFMACLFKTFQRRAGKDLVKMEAAYAESPLDYLLVKPVGIGEEVEPVGRYYLQEAGKKVRDVAEGKVMEDEIVGGNMAKMDVARFMVVEALKPTLHRISQVVGAKPGTPM